ncbi:dynein heavy chain 6, axonemal isoform X2 [Photinus pyralis]|uniref:dynein heavy chain 6, axonemal isoform X2 n=1 Tax=Photinus pyralis TaxID=7054 RepID=UPI001266F602|nr:dynein heavy chain 6, axonemal isoform X2 [Photinus pyralis]
MQRRFSKLAKNRIDPKITRAGSPSVIPFHVPHKKLLEKIESKRQEKEPLTGYLNRQNALCKHKTFFEDSSTKKRSRLSLDKHKSKVLFASPRDLIRTPRVVGSTFVLPHHRLPEVVDQAELIKQFKEEKGGFFIYMIYACPRSSEYYTPYALKIVPYKEIDKSNFMTMSSHGVMQHVGTEVVFTHLHKWELEYNMYCRLMKIKSFFNFRLWKTFYVWRKGILYKKFQKAATFLNGNLFMLLPSLRVALIDIQHLCYVTAGLNFMDVSTIKNWHLFYFIEAQMEKLEMVVHKLKEFREVVREIVVNACHGALLAQGFVVNEYLLEDGQGKKKDRTLKLSYIEQAKKGKFCLRLTCFITLVDYMIINMLHNVTMTSFVELMDTFKQHLDYLPSLGTSELAEYDTRIEKPRPEGSTELPLFIVNVVAGSCEMGTEPCYETAEGIFQQIIALWIQSVKDIRPLIADSVYEPFTNPMINGKKEDRICGYGPPISFYLEDDEHLQSVQQETFNLLKFNYEAAHVYIQRLEPIRTFFAADLGTTAETIEKERVLEVFRGWCTRYHKEVEIVNTVIDLQPLGILYMNQKLFKQTILPEPKRLINIIEHTMPCIGKDKVNGLLQEAEESQLFLEVPPTTTLEIVDYLMFVEKAVLRMDEMELELEYCKELYDIMEEFRIMIDPDELSNYLGLSINIGNLRNLVDKKNEERPTTIKKLNDQLNKDISNLISEVGIIKDECLEPWLYDIESDAKEATNFLDTLYTRLSACQGRAGEFKSYQKQFRMEVTRFDMLDEVMNDLKLRMLLWESLDSWHKEVKEWYTTDFQTLNTEEMNLFTAKTVKNITQLEKGLPRNLILPKLKDEVELVKNKLPTITYLRNPSLRQRHWLKIENVLNHKFKAEEMITLTMLEELRVFDYPDEIMEISGQASSEAGLELLLKKVEESWKTIEFSVVPHRDAKDVYILGSLEEIQVVLDDSNINIATIASSRHVGPIKPRVEEWARLLDLFSRTLDEWQLCQQSWVYLEIIFSAPDIQRQLPSEAKMFLIVDKSWKEIMRRTAKVPLAIDAATYPGLLETFIKNNALLEQIMKCLESYLETKRVSFPRFYFLSNDELLDILAQTRNPFAVQPHLRKCFDAIAKLEFGTKVANEEEDEEGTGKQEVIMTTDIIAMISPEGERVELGKGLKARGNVEDWLGKVEESMFVSLRRRMRFSLEHYFTLAREDWVVCHPNQIILTMSQVMWARDVHAILDGNGNKLSELPMFEKKCIINLNKLAGLVRKDLTPVVRKILVALITIDVHARDTITSMAKNKVQSSIDFEWLKMIRYYWLESIDNCVARMSSAELPYGYEYLGAGGVLVITPLTDKCYLCLMGALQLDLGGAPAGPAGTGKTETTKDLAKALAIQCVVFNCSEGLDYKMMGRFFSGLAQSGAWCCFDEFNRIDIEVLSVIAQQLITIRNAKAAKLQRFMFEGREIKLVQRCAAFITMNPGYAGRTELPDNLKALFRPVSMMVPDYALIAEVTLYSEGFESSKILSHKMVQMYKLCSEQLSLQDHYDFGMRAVKSVLVMAGTLKRASPDRNEEIVLICALRDSNLPKFLTDDAVLFQGILSDLFPGVTLPVQEYGDFLVAIENSLEAQNLQTEASMAKKIIQLYETMIVRWGVMLVGPTGGGKSSILYTLKLALEKMHHDGFEGPYYRPVHTYIMNPKAVTAGELYGEVNPFTLEWRDGLMGIMVRTSVQSTNDDHQWVICDGPVDAVWIENLNTVLDDNKMLCLANSERIKLTPYVHMVFEVQDLTQASPATVSRCGMVYVDPDELKWLPYVKSWAVTLSERFLNQEMKEYVVSLFEYAVEHGLVFMKRYCQHSIHQVEVSKATAICKLIESVISIPGMIERVGEKSRVRNFVCQIFIFAYLWGAGGNLLDASREKFETYVHDQFDEFPDAKLPPGANLWDLFPSTAARRLEPWVKIIPTFTYDSTTPFFEMLVPTIDTIRFGYIMKKLVETKYPVLFTGDTGVGKSVIAKEVLNSLFEMGSWIPITLNFSAQTSSLRTQEMLEAKLDKRKKTLLGAPIGKRVVLFVDDVNMPKLEKYGAQPPIELLRQFLDFGGLYDREKLFWKAIVDVVITAACAPPGGGRNPLTPRFVRHFGMFFIPPPNEYSLKAIFKAIMRGFLFDFANPVRDLADSLVNAAVDVYNRIAEDLLPTPAKSHYVFNLRDLSKCVQGVLQADSGSLREANQIMRLFYHECLRVFHDRLINDEDKSYFYFLMKEVCGRSFGTPVLQLPDEPIIHHPPILLFGDFIVFGAAREDRIYEELQDVNKLKNMLQEYLEDYNLTTSKEMHLIFFVDAMEHTCRLSRILRSERGNGLLVGVGGMGKQSLTRLASHINGYKCFQIELTRNYDHNSFFEDLRKLYFNAGAVNENTVFLFTDTQIVQEEFLEDVNNILNSGEVPNLFEADELEKVIIATRPAAKEAGVSEGNRDLIFTYFINRVRRNLHLSLCMSPVGDAFRRRCRMFPSLVNCCTIDWFSKWPEEALLSVAQNSLKEIGKSDVVDKLANMCVVMHKSVEDMTVRFYAEMKRHYYTTPSSYLELLKLYLNMLVDKRQLIQKTSDRIANGLQKLYETNSIIDAMKEELTAMEPILAEKSVAIAKLMVNLTAKQEQADKVRTIVKADEDSAKVKAAETQAIADDAQRDLDVALPAIEAATRALESLNKNDINELKVFQKPPDLVRFVMESVCLLLGSKTDWASAKVVMGDVNFLKRLQEYNKDNIPDSLLKKLKVYIDNVDFIPEKVAKVSAACKSLCMWVRAIDTYAKVYKVVEPKRRRLHDAEVELNDVMGVLKAKQQQLADVEAMIQSLQDDFEASVAEKRYLEDTMALTAVRLVRAGKLNVALGDEQIRWEIGVKNFAIQLSNLIGDILISAGCVAYMGAFTSTYRKNLITEWTEKCKLIEIPYSDNYSLVTVLADPYSIRIWNACGLPRDTISTENAILVTQARRWPLMIDPQEQANRWIRQMEGQQLRITKLTDSNFLRILETAIRIGLSVLLEEVEETLDPTLAPILLKQTFLQGGRMLIRLGDSDIEYDSNFRFYITTKLSNPHYLPEICIQVTIVNFTVTPSGLEDQLLADVVRLERPDFEKQRTELITRINNDKGQLKAIEDKILRLLFASEGNILDDEELIETLNESKETSAIIAARLTETEATEEKISIAREKYRPVSTRGSVLYFVVAVLAEIDPMYQFSLKYFNQIFCNVIQISEKDDHLPNRLQILNREITLAMYINVSRSLFERHKLVFSFMVCVAILLQQGTISESQYNYLLRGPVGFKSPMDKKPNCTLLTDPIWLAVKYLAFAFEPFKYLPDDILSRITVTIGGYDQTIEFIPNSLNSKIGWNSHLDDFEKLMLLKTLREEKLVFGITEYVRIHLGQKFVESPAISLSVLYKDISNSVPLIFVLSAGSDPFGAFHRFATDMGYQERILSISLGQGQGPVAEKLIETGKNNGSWVFLQNCHLATSWMLPMERIILAIVEDSSKVHTDFRLFMSSMPSRTFPVSVLQNAVKVTNEPPKGLRTNVKRALEEMLDTFFEDHPLGQDWRKVLFGLCMFHAVIQERKKFGPLGWNIIYEFNNSDREFAFSTLRMYCDIGFIPWDALEYITGEITYGGRVTDSWDLRCLKTILKGFFSPSTLEPGYTYSKSGVYYCPEYEKLEEYRDFVDTFPIIEEPEIFGMHENANIAYQTKETQTVIRTMIDCQPSTSGGGEGKSADEIAFELAEGVIQSIIKKIYTDNAHPHLFKRDKKDRLPSLTTVLMQEVDRFNKLLALIHSSMNNLQKAIKGFVVMSEQLEEVYRAFLNNQVPIMWSSKSYPSLKSLGSWVHDLELRLDFICIWIEHYHPPSYWLSGFYFTQGFLTGTLQTHARKYDLPIDQLKYDFVMQKLFIDQELIKITHDAEKREVASAYGDLTVPLDGVLIHGLFVDAGLFDNLSMTLVDPNPGEINPPLPAVLFLPTTKTPSIENRYICPLYKTSVRAGTLSTTGHSTNFVTAILLPSQKPQSHWILKGTALLTQVTD